MAIRLANNCSNCSNLSNHLCSVHKVEVSEKHTCDTFSMMSAIKDEMMCSTCSRFENDDCAHPDKATPEMLCTHWAPNRIN